MSPGTAARAAPASWLRPGRAAGRRGWGAGAERAWWPVLGP